MNVKAVFTATRTTSRDQPYVDGVDGCASQTNQPAWRCIALAR